MSKIAEYVQLTRQIVLEANGATQHDSGEDAYQNFVRRGLRRYSIDKPNIKVSAFAGIDSTYITVNSSNLPSYVDGFSKIEGIEASAPTISDNERPSFIDRDKWDLYRDDTELRIHFKSHKPRTTDTIRVSYTIPHTIDELDGETTDSVMSQDREAIILYAASQAILALASRASGTSDPTLRADVVNYRTKSQELIKLSEQYKQMYTDWISDPQKAASIIRDLDFGFSFGDSQPFLTHRSFSRQ